MSSADRKHLSLTLNGKTITLLSQPSAPLVDVLRDEAGVKGPRIGCRNGDCGACTVLIDDEPYKSCIVACARADGREVETLDGLAKDTLSAVQEAFWSHNAFQCGYCMSGHILCLVALFRQQDKVTRQDIDDAIAGNLCRCTGYQNIVNAALSLIDR
ncbi:(2Fe-2S)-binding protein [Paraburkholderia caledonica]|uniref:Carbon-monoxide dehydrogenase small subunit n=1 Tax=Paraburkholderia caledonica TaxID=134536 RepID=A0ABU1KYT1_9BURK|nr:carbon-monoxide dehydrogenase small subunit [Paraburkholderia caledonica]